VDPGNYVSTGAVSLVNIQRQDPVYVDFNISENDLARLRENMPGNQLSVDVVAPTQPDITKSGTLTFLDNTVSTQAGTVLLRATIPNGDHYLWPGQYVKVALTLQTLTGAVVVPSQTIQVGAKGPYLFVVRTDNTVEQRLVTQGVHYRDFVVVANGLKADETVVVEGQLTIGNGAKVNPSPYRGGIPGGSPPDNGLTQSQHSGDPNSQGDPTASPKPAL
jgi:multidrug efflux system membrane fusion protein